MNLYSADFLDSSSLGTITQTSLNCPPVEGLKQVDELSPGYWQTLMTFQFTETMPAGRYIVQATGAVAFPTVIESTFPGFADIDGSLPGDWTFYDAFSYPTGATFASASNDFVEPTCFYSVAEVTVDSEWNLFRWELYTTDDPEGVGGAMQISIIKVDEEDYTGTVTGIPT